MHAHVIIAKKLIFFIQRWLPIEGFSSKLLPTDRYNFSNIDGTANRSLESIHCPSAAWQWEDVWQKELTLEGQHLDHDGWTYAVDFPATFHPKKQWKSCVRRRLWVRTRKYIAMNTWITISPLHKDATNVSGFRYCKIIVFRYWV